MRVSSVPSADLLSGANDLAKPTFDPFCWREENSRPFLVLLMFCSIIGCGGTAEPRRVAVNGMDIAVGQLVPKGTIRFLPQAGNKGPVAMTSVHDGLYSFTKTDGPYPGKYKVIVNLELELQELAKMARENPSSSPPPMSWEEEVMLPDEETVTQHFMWLKEAEDTAQQKTNMKPTP